MDLLNWLCEYEERHHDGGSGSGVRVLRAPDTMEGPLAPALLHAVGLPSTSLWLLWDPNSLACSLPVVAAFPNAGVRLVRLGGQVAFAALLCFAFAFIALRLLFFCGCGPFAGVSHTGTLNNNCVAREGHLRKAVCITR